MTKEKVFVMFTIIMAIASLSFSVYTYVYYETLVQTMRVETLDKLFVAGFTMALVYLSMGITVLTGFSKKTPVALIISICLFLASIM